MYKKKQKNKNKNKKQKQKAKNKEKFKLTTVNNYLNFDFFIKSSKYFKNARRVDARNRYHRMVPPSIVPLSR